MDCVICQNFHIKPFEKNPFAANFSLFIGKAFYSHKENAAALPVCLAI
jgi:hypothetical protein